MAQLAASALLSGLSAALVAIAATVVIERCGGVVGGVLASTPTTIIPAAVGMAYRLSPESLYVALFAVPMGVFCSALFLLAWRELPRRLPSAWSSRTALVFCVASTLSGWLLLAGCAVLIRVNSGPGATTALGAVSVVCVAALGVATTLSPFDAPRGKNPVSKWVLLLRGVAAGTSIGIAVAIAAVDDIAGGIATAFPAVFCTTMVALWLAQGEAVGAGASGPMILGSTSVAVYSMVFVPVMGATGSPIAAAALTWVLCVACVSLPVAAFVRWRARVSPGGSSSTRRVLIGGGASSKVVENASSSSLPSFESVAAGDARASAPRGPTSEPPIVVIELPLPEPPPDGAPAAATAAAGGSSDHCSEAETSAMSGALAGVSVDMRPVLSS